MLEVQRQKKKGGGSGTDVLENDVEAVSRLDEAKVFYNIVMLVTGQLSCSLGSSLFPILTYMEVFQKINFDL